MTITEFLEARLAEDEQVARAAAASDPSSQGNYLDEGPAGNAWTAEDGMVLSESGTMWDCEGSSTLCTTDEVATHFARHDPARVLAECAAKRAIVESLSVLSRENLKGDPVRCGMYSALCDVVMDLSFVYKGHPDYRQEWAL